MQILFQSGRHGVAVARSRFASLTITSIDVFHEDQYYCYLEPRRAV